MSVPLSQSVHEENASLKEEVVRLRLLVSTFQQQLRLLRGQHFGAASEQHQYQPWLFDEAEQAVREMPPAIVQVAAHAKATPGRRPLPPGLPRFTDVHPLASDICACGHPLTMIEPLRSEQLDIIPAQMFVREHVRERGVCRACDTPPVVAPLPPQPIPKSHASPGLLAFTAVSKYADALPLYRQSAMHARMDIDLPRHTLAGHMVAGGGLLTPLVNLMTDHALDSGAVNMDETPVQVLKEPKRPAQTKSTMWVLRGGLPGRAVVRFEYDVSRGGEVIERLLADYRGYLQRDGYAAYAKVSAREGVIGLACFAHVRRKFLDAMKALPANARKQATATREGVTFITDLYEVEREIKGATIEVRKATRMEKSMPILARFKTWLDAQLVPPKSLLGQAIGYARKEWPYLTTYCLDGRLSIDNNPAENAIRPFVVGRKNWLFADTQHGAVASANFYTVIETCKANGINPYAYLKHVFTELPKAQTLEDFEALLPWNIPNTTLDDMLRVPKLPS